jgi:hypothetical protein
MLMSATIKQVTERDVAIEEAIAAIHALYDEACHNVVVYRRDGRFLDANHYEERAAAFSLAEERLRRLPPTRRP